jgi:hypothetical protein
MHNEFTARNRFSAQIVTIYCLCDDFLRAWGHRDHPQTKMSTAQVMTVALVAAALFHGNQERSRCFLQEHGYIKTMLSKSRLNRRFHRIPEALWQGLMALLGETHKQINETQEYLVDSMPIPVCDNMRIWRSRLYPPRQYGEAFRGYIASKKRYFYGLRLHLIVTKSGQPVEAVLLPGSVADVTGLHCLPLDLAAGATLLADAGYTDYDWEDALLADAGVRLVSLRRGNSKRPLPAWVRFICQRSRRQIETVFSRIASLLARSIHAVTAHGFELKVFLTVLAYAIIG